MSTKLVKDELLRFLTSTNEEVLCIRGKWGTGKTWTWRDMLTSNRSKIALKKYAYVSLFGLNSLAQVRSQVFQNTIDTNQIGKDFSLEDMEASVKASWGWAKRGLALVHRLGAGSDDMESALSLLALSARNQIICIDDLERKGKDLDAADVLGYASQLKDERKCKVVFLLNEEGLDKKNRDAYDAYLEKVVDVSLLFAPTPLESVGIALKGADEASELTRKYCLMLGLENVRSLRRFTRQSRSLTRC
ncbi:MAG TPA: P-loop NTPase fold protein [Rhizobium sp.]|uniref:P-loop NTPase fold protein n=1 Tax=Rhizobium sp. F40D2 TaxID=3453141 RepID=UPI002D07292D|nr:P-loop NTPase fold protein [Rhizobium sp.]